MDKITRDSPALDFGRKEMYKRMRGLAGSVIKAELKYIPPNAHFLFSLVGKAGFVVEDIPNNAIHIPTTTDETVELMDELRDSHMVPSEIRALDLGCGLGSFVDSLSVYLDYIKIERFRITGVDLSPSVLADAQRIADGRHIRNVSFEQRDFTKMTREELGGFNFVYLYKPFNEGFFTSMEDLLPRLSPGTVLVTRLCKGVRSLSSDQFRLMLHPLYLKYNDEYTVHVRQEVQKA